MKSPEEVRQEAKQKAYEWAAIKLALEARHYLNTGVGAPFLDEALKEFARCHYEKTLEEDK